MGIKIKKSDSGVYWAEFNDGEVIAENSSAVDSVFQAALNLTGDIEFDDGKTTAGVNYDFSGSFAGVKVKSRTRVRGSKNVSLRVPSAYTGDVIILDTAYITPSVQLSHFTWDGLTFKEAGATSYNWKAFHFLSNGDAHGIVYVDIRNCDIQYASRGCILESAHAGAWINACFFTDITNSGARVGFEWKKDAVGGIPFNAINRINFTRCFHQSSSITEYGFKAVDGEGHFFDDTRVYDIHESAQPNPKISQFLSTANKIFIHGGIMSSKTTPAWMDWQCPKGNITVIDPFLDPILRGDNKGIRTHPSSCDGKTSVFTIPHGQITTPTIYNVKALTPDALVGHFKIDVDATNFTLTYIDRLPPPTTLGNPIGHLKWYWEVIR